MEEESWRERERERERARESKLRLRCKTKEEPCGKRGRGLDRLDRITKKFIQFSRFMERTTHYQKLRYLATLPSGPRGAYLP